jgi:hypothetical protein
MNVHVFILKWVLIMFDNELGTGFGVAGGGGTFSGMNQGVGATPGGFGGSSALSGGGQSGFGFGAAQPQQASSVTSFGSPSKVNISVTESSLFIIL